VAHLIRPWQVRYLDKDGKRCPRDAPGARTVRERARKWYGQGIPGYPPQKRFPLASDKQVARQMLAKLVHRAERGEAGLEDEATFAQTRPLTEHLQDFAAGLRAKASAPSEKQIKQVLQRIGDTFDACCFVYPRDVNADAIETYLASRRQLLREQGGLSMQTSNFYLAAIKQFCHWMVKKGRLAKTPLRDVEPGNVRLDRRHDRRDLKPEELALLLDVTRASSWIFRGLSGIDRHALYLTSCGTGFRKSELASLTPERFDLDSDPPTVVISAANDTGPFAVSHWARRFAVSPRMTANRPAPNRPSLKQQTALTPSPSSTISPWPNSTRTVV
jgi:integrase